MSKNKNLHQVFQCDDGTFAVGNYGDVTETGGRDASGHKLYFATCKTCGEVVIKKMSDLRRMSLKCRHKYHGWIYGVGINDMQTGWMRENELNGRIYDVWRHMLLRTTAEFWVQHPTYIDTTVCDEWIYLSNFVADISLIPGYEFWLNNLNKMIMLDKDTRVSGNKCYSKELCCFISHADSNRDVHRRHPEVMQKANKTYSAKYSVTVKAIEVNTGECLVFESRRAASRALNIAVSDIWMILSTDEKYSSHKSAISPDGKRWTFE